MERQTKTPLIPNKVYKNLPLILRDVTRDFSGREKDMLLTSSLGVLSSYYLISMDIMTLI